MHIREILVSRTFCGLFDTFFVYLCPQNIVVSFIIFLFLFLTDIFENFGGFGSFPGFSHGGRSRGRGRPGFPAETMEFEDVPFASQQKKDPPITYDLLVTYEELFSGTKKKMKVINSDLLVTD